MYKIRKSASDTDRAVYCIVYRMSAISERFYVIINYQVLSYCLLAAGLGSDLHKDHQHNIKVDPKTDTYLYCILNLNLGA